MGSHRYRGRSGSGRSLAALFGVFSLLGLLALSASCVKGQSEEAKATATANAQAQATATVKAAADEHMVKAGQLLLAGRWLEAIPEFDAVLKIDPARAGAYAGRGICFANLDNFDYGLEDLSKAIYIDQTVATYYSQRGRIYGLLGEFDEAVADYDQAITLDPADQLAHLNRGIIRADNLDQFQAALEDYNKALAVADSAEGHYNRGRVEVVLDLYQEALADFNRAFELGVEPKLEPFVYYERGRAYLAIGNFTQALADASRSIELDSRWPQFVAGRGLAYAKLGQTAAAIADLTYYLGAGVDPKLRAQVEAELAKLR